MFEMMNSKNRLRNKISGMKAGKCFFLCLIFSLLSACGIYEVKDSAPSNYTKKWNEIPDAVPVDVVPSKYGNPKTYEVFGKRYYPIDSAHGFSEKGIASWYGKKFHGQRTSSGEVYDMYKMTAAHKTLPIPVFVEVSNLENGRKAIVRVNDRGPFHEGRVIDLSYAAATKLGVAATGTANVFIRVVGKNFDKDVAVVSTGAIIDNVAIDNSAVNNAVIGNAVVNNTVVNNAAINNTVEPPVVSGDKLFIQVAAFSDESNAINFLRTLNNEGFRDVRMYIDSKAGNSVYRVKIGPLASQSVAENVLSQLEQKNHKKLKIVKIN